MAKSEISEWMPIEIARLYSSAKFQAMKDFQKWWYMALLLQAWKSDNPCYLPSNAEELRILAGAPPEKAWREHGKLVLSCFDVQGDSATIANSTQLEVYQRQMSRYETNKANGKKGAESRWRKDSKAIAPPSFANGSTSRSESTSQSVVEREEPKTKTLNYEFSIEPFDSETWTQRIQNLWKWKPGGWGSIEYIREAIEKEAEMRKWTRLEVVTRITERMEIIADLIEKWPASEKRFIPSLAEFMSKRMWENEYSTWERGSGSKTDF